MVHIFALVVERRDRAVFFVYNHGLSDICMFGNGNIIFVVTDEVAMSIER